MDAVQPEWPTTAGQWVRLVGQLRQPHHAARVWPIARIGRATIRRGPRGLFLGEGYRLKFPVAGAFTVGNVITTGSDLGRDAHALAARCCSTRSGTPGSTSYCLGLPFYPAYAVCMGWSMLRTGDRAARNFFERQAGLADRRLRRRPARSGRSGSNCRAAIGQCRARPDVESIVRSIPEPLGRAHAAGGWPAAGAAA